MYVITGATGNTGKRISEALLAAGKQVTVIGRSADRLASLTEKGAVGAIGDLDDAEFLKTTFQGAEAVYLMVPPKWDVTDWRAYQREIIKNFTFALTDSGVKYAVVLSSQGAHMATGAGPVSGIGELEVALRQIEGLNVLNLRPSFFMENFFGNIPLIKQAGIQGYPLPADFKMPFVHTKDIADVAVKHLLALDFTGHSHRFIAGPTDLTMAEATETLSKAIGQPIHYVEFTPEQNKEGMMGAGIPETIADGYNELFVGLSSGDYLGDGFVRTPEVSTPTTLEQFAVNEFAYAFKA